MEGLGIAHAEGIYMAKKSRITAPPTLLEIGPHLGVRNGERTGNAIMPASELFNAMLRRSCTDRTRTHGPPEMANKSEREQSNAGGPHPSTSGGWQRRFECRGLLKYMLRRLHDTAATSRANWLLRRVEIALHWHRVRFAGLQAVAECKADEFGISHASSGGF